MDRVLLLVEHKGNRRLLEEWLARRYQVVPGDTEQALDTRFDVALLDGPTLDRLCPRVQARRVVEEPVFLPFLLLIPRQTGSVVTRHLGRTVDELILTPIDRAELHARVENLLRMRKLSLELKRQHDLVDRLSVTDDVSGFHNTRFLHRYLDDLLAQPNAAERGVSLVFFDMDGFKKVVDTHGHLLGAKVLKEVAQVVHKHLDPEDRIVRYGGDEYVVILPGQSKAQALAKVERIRLGLVSTPYLQEEEINVQVTASFGLATFPHDARDKRELLAAADQCLFQSKERGKDRITTSDSQCRENSP